MCVLVFLAVLLYIYTYIGLACFSVLQYVLVMASVFVYGLVCSVSKTYFCPSWCDFVCVSTC